MADHSDDLDQLPDKRPEETLPWDHRTGFTFLFSPQATASDSNGIGFSCLSPASELRLFAIGVICAAVNLLAFPNCLPHHAWSGDGGEKNPQSSSMPSDVQGLGMGLPDLRSKKKGKQKVSKDSHVSEALDELTEQTTESVKGLESIGSRPGAGDIENDAMMEDWAKQFEELAGTK